MDNLYELSAFDLFDISHAVHVFHISYGSLMDKMQYCLQQHKLRNSPINVQLSFPYTILLHFYGL